MNIIEALQALKEGKKITVDNDCFPKGNYIYYDKNYVDEHGCFPFGKKTERGIGWSLNFNKGNTLESDIYHIYQKSILDDTEKKYLENIIAPFKDKVAFIMKFKGLKKSDKKYECIRIATVGKYYEFLYETIELPYFEEGTMYNGMEACKEYSMSELGLFEQ